MCELDCDEMYCDCCANNTSDLAEINFMFARKRYEDAVMQVDEIKLLLIKAISTRRGLFREFLIALEEKQKKGVL